MNPSSTFVDMDVHLDYDVCKIRFSLEGEFISYYCHTPPVNKGRKTDV
ncbi:hypothetical protein [Methanococcoides sp. AM1]|nr:hypothetical protein [Methanococcoides sp. AM1]